MRLCQTAAAMPTPNPIAECPRATRLGKRHGAGIPAWLLPLLAPLLLAGPTMAACPAVHPSCTDSIAPNPSFNTPGAQCCGPISLAGSNHAVTSGSCKGTTADTLKYDW